MIYIAGHVEDGVVVKDSSAAFSLTVDFRTMTVNVAYPSASVTYTLEMLFDLDMEGLIVPIRKSPDVYEQWVHYVFCDVDIYKYITSCYEKFAGRELETILLKGEES